MKLILASSSPRRRELLAEAGYQFQVVAPDPEVECGVCSTAGPAELVAELALKKGVDVAGRLPPDEVGTVILAADTVAECSGQILGKPADEEHARQMLQRLSGRVHRVFSGVCLLVAGSPPASRPPVVRVAVTTLRMDTLAEDELERYVDSGQWSGKAGGFGYQDRLGWVHIVEGSESNVVGLPMEIVRQMLTEAGLEAGPSILPGDE